MHSERAIRQANNQKPLKLEGVEVGQIATLIPLGAQVGIFEKLPIEAVTDESVTIDGNEFQAYMGSLVNYNGKLHTLDLPAQPVAA